LLLFLDYFSCLFFLQISMKTDWDTESVVFEWLPSQGQSQQQGQGQTERQAGVRVHPEVKVHYRVSLTGFGDDKNGGHTPTLLQYVSDVIGPLTSFLGVAHADAISLDLDDVEDSGVASPASVTPYFATSSVMPKK
jgi:hypothetical protein